MKCYVKNCPSSHKKRQCGVSFHKIPLDRNVKDEWLRAIGRPTNISIHYERICSLHFNAWEVESTGERKRIKKGCKPTQNLPSTDNERLVKRDSNKRVLLPEIDDIILGTDERKIEVEDEPSTSASDVLLPSEIDDNIILGTEKIKFEVEDEPSTSASDVLLPEIDDIISDIILGTEKRKFEVQDEPSPSASDVLLPEIDDTIILGTKKRKFEVEDEPSPSASDVLLPEIDDTIILGTKKRKFEVEDELSTSASSQMNHGKDSCCVMHDESFSCKYYEEKLTNERRKVRRYQEKLKTITKLSQRQKKRILHWRHLFLKLRKKHYLTQSAMDHLEQCLEGVPLALMKRIQKQSRSSAITRKPFPPELKTFAMTLNFYSQKAYEYVRKELKFSLPGQSTIRSWLSKVNCDPGFSEPSFRALRIKAKEFQAGQSNTKVPLMLSLLLDEMSIKKYIEVEPATLKTRGYVDVGGGESEELEPATEALVLMVVGVNSNFKLPIGYFLIKSLSGEKKALLVNQALHLISEATEDVEVLSVTCDGPQVHFKMLTSLGCNFDDIFNLKTFFFHPVTKSRVYVILDVCHMLKLVRNNWEKFGRIRDSNGNIVDWSFVKKLHDLQENESLVLANKLRKKHIQFRKQIMKVNLAAQTLSQSVADALDFLRCELNLAEFKEAQATSNFIRTVNNLFDLLNSRNPFGRGYKTPMRKENESYWRPFLETAVNYISQCTTFDGTPLIKTKQKTGFLGFIISATSLLNIYNEQVKMASNLKYLLTYKFSQDHLELFFCSIRSRNGWINNPSCLEFIRTYKRLLMGHNLKDLQGNCVAQDQTTTLTLTTFNAPLESTEVHNNRKCDKGDELYSTAAIISDELSLPLHFTEFSENVVAYIAGYVIRMIKKLHKCPTCIESLLAGDDDRDNASLKLIRFKSKGGLLLPSYSLRKTCNTIEKKIQVIFKLFDDKLPNGDIFIQTLLRESNNFLADKNLFSSLDNHIFDTPITDNLHKKVLIDLIIKCYAKIRLHSLAKKMNEKIIGEKVRKSLSRLIIFKHQ